MRKIKHGRLAGGCSDACCLKLEGLSVHIQGEDILEDVSFHLHCGEIAALIARHNVRPREENKLKHTAKIKKS